MISTCWSPGYPVDIAATVGPLCRGAGDPTHRFGRDGAFWRTSLTPGGPSTLRISRNGRGEVAGAAWGPGAAWALDALPDLLGARDDPGSFVPMHPLVRDVHAGRPGLRMPRTGLVFEQLAPAVLEQKVTGTEARRSWRELLWRYGLPAPGPAPRGMRVVPPASVWVRIPSWEWHRAGVDGKRAQTIIRAARVASRLEETVAMAPDDALRRLRTVAGIGVWTAAEVAQRAYGNADAVSIGDLHIPRLVGWALLRRPLDDDGMLDVLAPYAPHRHRVVRLIELSGFRKPRFAQRYSTKDYRSF